MALSADETCSEEYLYCVGHVVQRRTCIADVVTDGRIIPRVTTSGEELLDKKVVGSVFPNGLLNPLDVGTTITLALIRAEGGGGYRPSSCSYG